MDQQHTDHLTTRRRPASRGDGLEADVRHLHGRVQAVMRELSAYEAALNQHSTGDLTGPVLVALRAALVPRSATVGTLGHLESTLADLLCRLARQEAPDA